MFIVGSNAPADLAAQSVRIVMADEVDRYEASAGEEGDPLELAEQWRSHLLLRALEPPLRVSKKGTRFRPVPTLANAGFFETSQPV
jgi:hypothetical protein